MAKLDAQILKQALDEFQGDLAQMSGSEDAADDVFRMARLPAEDLERLAAIINIFAAGKHPMDMTPAEFNEYLGAKA